MLYECHGAHGFSHDGGRMYPDRCDDMAGQDEKKLRLLRKKPRLWIDIVIYAIVGLMLMHYTYFEAIAYGNAATATVVLYSCPAMVIRYNAIRHRKLPSKEEVITVFLAVGGTYFLVTGGDPAKLSVSFLCIALALFNGVVYSFASMYPKHIFLQVDKTFVLAVSMIIGGLACWGLSLILTGLPSSTRISSSASHGSSSSVRSQPSSYIIVPIPAAGTHHGGE